MPDLLHVVRTTIFPGNALGPPRTVPSRAEQQRLRRGAARALLDATPGTVARWLFAVPNSDGGGESGGAGPVGDEEYAVHHQEAATGAGQHPQGHGRGVPADPDPARERMLLELELGVLDVFGDEYMNRCLVFAIVELVVVRLIPEMAEKGTREMLEEKIGPDAWADWNDPNLS